MSMNQSVTPLFSQTGVVEKGTAQARKIGFPTANVHYEQAEISGTYAAKVLIGKAEYQSAVYANQARQFLEAHLFDFSEDLYGKEVTIILLEKIADSEDFRDSKDEKTFIEYIVSEVRKYFNREE